MKLHGVLLAIVLALVGCKDKKDEKAETPPATTPDAGKPTEPPPETGSLPTVPLAATRDLAPTAFVRIAADSTLTVGAIPATAIAGGSLAAEPPAGTATDLPGLVEALQAVDAPGRGDWRKQRAIEEASKGGIIEPLPPAWPRAGDLHARGVRTHDDPWAPVVFVAPTAPASRLLEVIRTVGRGAHLAVLTDGDAIRALRLFVAHVTFGSGTEEPSEVLVVIRRGDDPRAVFDQAIADKKRTPESGDPWVRLQPGEGVTAGELIGAIGAIDAHSPLGMVLGQTVAPPPTSILGGAAE